MRCMFLLLLSILTIYSMEKLPLDIITYNITPHLDRQERNILKSINHRFYAVIIPQQHLNELYIVACQKNDEIGIKHLQRKGALKHYQEIYYLFVHNRQNLAKGIYDHYHYTIGFDEFSYGIQQKNSNFISWLLHVFQPEAESKILFKAHAFAQQYADKEISALLEGYIKNNRSHIKSSHSCYQPIGAFSTSFGSLLNIMGRPNIFFKNS